MNRFIKSDRVAVGPVVPPGDEITGGGNCWVVTDPIVFAAPRLKMLIPSCLPTERSTLAKRTFNKICGSEEGTSTYSRFTTFPAVEAISTARAELVRSFTVP